jgi:hypothetical protein
VSSKTRPRQYWIYMPRLLDTHTLPDSAAGSKATCTSRMTPDADYCRQPSLEPERQPRTRGSLWAHYSLWSNPHAVYNHVQGCAHPAQPLQWREDRGAVCSPTSSCQAGRRQIGAAPVQHISALESQLRLRNTADASAL